MQVSKNVERTRMSPSGKPRGWIGARHYQTLILFLGLSLAFTMRVNLSVAIVAMTDPSTNPRFEFMYLFIAFSILTVNWSTLQKSYLLSVFFYGYIPSNFLAGYLANRLKPSRLLTIAGFLSALTTILTPLFVLNLGYAATCALRVCNGLFQGFFFTCTNMILSKWAIAKERGRLFSFVFSGSSAGSVLVLASGGAIAAGPCGWPTIFYVSGGCCVVWSLISFFVLYDCPSNHPTISAEERRYIQSNLVESSENSDKLPIPWKDILTSGPLIANVFAELGQNWGYWTLLTLLPTYMNGVLNFNMDTNGLLSSLPYLAKFITSFIFPFWADSLIEKQLTSLTASRKIWNSIAEFGGALAILVLAFYNSSGEIAITLVTIGVGLNSATHSGYVPITVDLSPNFAGVIMGLRNGISAVASLVSPTIAGLILRDETDASQWKIIFLLSSAIFALGNLIFLLYGSAEIQSWNEPGASESTRL